MTTLSGSPRMRTMVARWSGSRSKRQSPPPPATPSGRSAVGAWTWADDAERAHIWRIVPSRLIRNLRRQGFLDATHLADIPHLHPGDNIGGQRHIRPESRPIVDADPDPEAAVSDVADSVGADWVSAADTLRKLFRYIDERNIEEPETFLVTHAWTDGPMMHVVYRQASGAPSIGVMNNDIGNTDS